VIIELLIGTGLVAASSAVAGYLARRRALRQQKASPGAGAARTSSGTARAPGADPRDASASAEAVTRGLRVDDVLLYANEELWLAGAISLDEEGFVARLFRTPGAARCDWLLQLDPAAERIALLVETTDVPTGAVPERLRVDGMLLSLVRRGSAQLAAEGEQLPKGVAGRARYAILGAPGGRTLIVLDVEGGARIAAAGEQVPREMLDLLPGGDAPRAQTTPR